MNYFKSLLGTLKNTLNFKGRASAQEYWRAYVAWSILMIAINIFVNIAVEYEPSGAVAYSAAVVIFYWFSSVFLTSLQIRRLHDINKSGWWILISLTLVGIIPLIYWSAIKSGNSKNQYGEVPEDANSSSIHRNIGLTLTFVIFTLSVLNFYNSFQNFAEWQVESLGDTDNEYQSIYKFFSAKPKKGAVVKFSFICSKTKDLAVILSTYQVNDNFELPIAIIDEKDSIIISSEPNGKLQNHSGKFNFFVSDKNNNVAYADASQESLLELINNKFTVSVRIKHITLSSEINANHPDVSKFIRDCHVVR